MAIDRLSSVSTLSIADLLPIFSGSLGSDAKATLGLLVTWLQAQLTADTAFTHQYFAPSATGWAVTIAPPSDGGNVYKLTGNAFPPPPPAAPPANTPMPWQ